MTFNSYIFILAFLPIFVILYFLSIKTGKFISKYVIIIGSIIFYVYAGWDVTCIFGLSVITNLALSFLAEKKRPQKYPLVLAIIFNIGLLFYFKYLNFTIDIINNISQLSIKKSKFLLPLGISFFTFQEIMYIVSVWNKSINKVHIIDYFAYILYFPKLIMGPLMEPMDFIIQINDAEKRKLDWRNIASGIKLFSLGLFKKVVLADTFARAVSWGFTTGVIPSGSGLTATSGDLFLVMLFYTFQIFFDFSGYSDMAVGASLMINILLPINFDSPYKALSIRDFWKRWHISLTNFFTKYVYFPLGGSRNGSCRTYMNIMIIFLISGIWHGANWTFILWGFIHGFLQCLERSFQKKWHKFNILFKWSCTFLMVNILWLLFRTDNIKQWVEMLIAMFSFANMKISDGLVKAFVLPESTFLFDKLNFIHANINVKTFSMLLFTALSFFVCLVPANNYKNMRKFNWFNMIICSIAFIWGFLCLGTESVFVYFNF